MSILLSLKRQNLVRISTREKSGEALCKEAGQTAKQELIIAK